MDFVRWMSSLFLRLTTPIEAVPQYTDLGPADKRYRIFTKDNDLIIGGDKLAASIDSFIAPLPAEGWRTVDPTLAGDARRAAESNLAAACTRLRERLTREQIEGTSVTLLLDHSGSMAGTRALVVADFAEAFADALIELGVAVEVLGFTTRAWLGGESRKAWIALGRPRYPGRLCDLLHVVHRNAHDTARKPHNFPSLRHPALYKENIDGEALQWARDRLMAQQRGVKILIVVSDGAPVDDSTLLVNWTGMLSDHVRAVIDEIEAEKCITLGGIGIEHDVAAYYPRSVVANPCGTLGNVAPAFVEQLIYLSTQDHPSSQG